MRRCDDWFAPLFPRPQPRLRLCCFPNAGGSASVFAPWAAALPAWVELRALQLPGRANRWRERPISSLDVLLPILREAIQPLTDLPLVFFGHSNGALVAYELARALRADPAVNLAYIVMSGKPAPHCWGRGVRRHQLDDERLLAELERFGGTPPELLSNRELMLEMLPTLRADFALSETHAFCATPPLDLPAALWWGREDPMVAPAEVQEWQRYLSRPAMLHGFAGRHFYLQQSRDAVLTAMLDILLGCEQLLARPRAASFTV